MIQLPDDRWALLPVFPELWTALSYDRRTPGEGSKRVEEGVFRLGWRPSDGRWPDYEGLPIRLLTGMLTGRLSTTELHFALAAIRKGKHADPMGGIVAATIYANIGDIESVRRTASYYPGVYQPVPFDIAALCDLPIKDGADGGFSIDLPDVPESAPPFQDAPEYTYEARAARGNVRVAGVVPILAAGWRHLNDTENQRLAALGELASFLTDAPITTFKSVSSLNDVLAALKLHQL